MGDLGTYDAGGFVFELTDGMTRVQWEQALNTYQVRMVLIVQTRSLGKR